MFTKTILTAAAALGVATAQTGPGFPIPATQALTVSFGNNTISPAGELIPRPETANPPNISSPVWYANSETNDGPGLLVMVDLDVPFNGSRIQLLHWMATDVRVGARDNSTKERPLIFSESPVPFVQPSPPVGDVPHSYNIVVFSQPSDFSLPAQYSNLSSNRVPFDVNQFRADAGLGAPIAGSYFQVQNLTGTATATFPPARSPTPTNTGNASSPGADTNAAIGGKASLVGLSTVLVAAIFAVAF
ncbi:hypothetical protein B5807_08395 [Epicoccum nigrum]|uniref:PEBP-like protein n=1 Tax=Epicoccum nigrum TaxID=105696 RepID=A0A1Y2LRX7_EPING|nr:hypothetical protein B5807_08395 [Epicoccum nigrum]